MDAARQKKDEKLMTVLSIVHTLYNIIAVAMFNLPQDALRNIFQFDSTYKDLFQTNVLNDLHTHAWKFWKKAFLKHLTIHEIEKSSTFHKLDFILTYILDNWDITCFRENDHSKLYPTDIVILLNYRNMAYRNGTIIADFHAGSEDILFVKITFDNCPRPFEAYVRTKDEAVNYYRTTSESDDTQILIHSNSTYFIYQIFTVEYNMFDGVLFPPFDD